MGQESLSSRERFKRNLRDFNSEKCFSEAFTFVSRKNLVKKSERVRKRKKQIDSMSKRQRGSEKEKLFFLFKSLQKLRNFRSIAIFVFFFQDFTYSVESIQLSDLLQTIELQWNVAYIGTRNGRIFVYDTQVRESHFCSFS